MTECQRIAALIQRASAGEADATAQFREEMEPHLARIVRRVLRVPVPSTPLAARVIDEARAVARESPTMIGREEIVAHISRALCTSMLEQGRAGLEQRVCETIFG